MYRNPDAFLSYFLLEVLTLPGLHSPVAASCSLARPFPLQELGSSESQFLSTLACLGGLSLSARLPAPSRVSLSLMVPCAASEAP